MQGLSSKTPQGRLRLRGQMADLGLEAGAVGGVSEQGVADMGHVDADLVRPPGLQPAFDQARDRLAVLAVEGLQHLPVGDGLAAAFADRDLVARIRMPLERRMELLRLASSRDFLVIEDDYEFETNYVNEPCPALKSLDDEGRVIYVGSLSKTLFPGLRLGFLVGPKALVAEARALRRLMVRHAPNNNQRTAALFLALGHHDTLIRRLHRAYRTRWEAMGGALQRHLPNASRIPTFGGTSFWVKGPARLDSEALARKAAEQGILIEPGRINFGAADPPRNYFRLAFSSIDEKHIEPGIRLLAQKIAEGERSSRQPSGDR